jgi:chemotaxis protein MotB
MKLSSLPLLFSFGLLLALPATTGCASQKKMKDYESELGALREERVGLKKENQSLRSQLDSYEMALAEANSKRTAEAAAPIVADTDAVKDYPKLDDAGVGYEQRDGNMVFTLPNEITFASGKADLTDKGKKALKEVAKILDAEYKDARYWIEGHTDTDPIKKAKFSSNRELSVARSMAVLVYLVEDCKVADGKCIVAGHSQYSPVDANNTSAGKARNRRVEIVVRKK